MNNIDYKAVVQILENFLKKEKTEILGISVGEEYQLRQAIENLIKENKELEEKNKELEKYDYRKIKLDEKDKISSIHFTKEQLDLMNLGIALYVGIPKILADKENEETDI